MKKAYGTKGTKWAKEGNKRKILICTLVAIMAFAMTGCKDEEPSHERSKVDVIYEETLVEDIRIEEIKVEEIHVNEISWEGDSVKRWD